MGTTNSSLVDRSIPRLVVESPKACPRGWVGLEDTSKPSQLSASVDDALWNDLILEIDPLARQLNRGFLTSLIIYMLVIGISVGIGMRLHTIDGYEHYPQSWVIAVWVVLPIYIGFILWVYEGNNRRVDRQIKHVLEMQQYRFEGAGYELKYLTQHTGFCKPKYARSERIIAFFPSESNAMENGQSSGTSSRVPMSVSQVQPQPSAPPKESSKSIYNTLDMELATGTTGPSLVDQLKQDDELYRSI